jgi:hypothetical protein
MIKGKVDAAIDLMQYPWPIKSNSVEEVFCAHYLEHIPHSTFLPIFMQVLRAAKTFEEYKTTFLEKFDSTPDEGFILFFNELGRIMKKGAIAKMICPYESSIRAWQDPTHVRAMNEASLLYVNKDWRVQNALDHMAITCDFDYGFGHDFLQDWQSKVQDQKDFGVRHYHNVATDIHYMLTKR